MIRVPTRRCAVRRELPSRPPPDGSELDAGARRSEAPRRAALRCVGRAAKRQLQLRSRSQFGTRQRFGEASE